MTPHSISTRRSLRAIGALGLALAALAAGVSNAHAYVSPAMAEHAADRGANWFQANQEASGALSSDWGMTALAAAGLNAADVSTSLLDPSAQDFYLDDWQANGPGGGGTDAARGILTGVAGGIQTSRLSVASDATKSNLVARIAELWDGTQIGSDGLLNDDIFGVLALYQAGAPQEMLRRDVDYLRTKQLGDGGWSWNASPGAPADTDMTGSVLAAFCAAGVSTEDPDVQQALTLLHNLQDPDTGGFIAPPESFGIGVNTDTTSWVVSGLIQCGIDPQGPEWTTTQGKTPLDYLVSMQRPDGHFAWTEEFDGGAFETFDSVRPLGGVAFSSGPPPRLDGTSPAVRPATTVPDGTTVPITLVIDHGPGAGDVRMCRVDIESGAGIAGVLQDATGSSTPADCVTQAASTSTGSGERIDSLNGVADTADYEWRARIDGGPAEAIVGDAIGFGDLVFLKFTAKVANPQQPPHVSVPPVQAPRAPRVRGPRVALDGKARWSDGSVQVPLLCPRGNGDGGCRGQLDIRFRRHRGERLLDGGSAPFEIGSGERSKVIVQASDALRMATASGKRVWLRVTAATRSEDGAVRLTHARRFIAG